jgi:hypothetical protein
MGLAESSANHAECEADGDEKKVFFMSSYLDGIQDEDVPRKRLELGCRFCPIAHELVKLAMSIDPNGISQLGHWSGEPRFGRPR